MSVARILFCDGADYDDDEAKGVDVTELGHVVRLMVMWVMMVMVQKTCRRSVARVPFGEHVCGHCDDEVVHACDTYALNGA